ncbi:MAG TPA: alpha-ribazole phosphatase [Methylotenera sp.]|nr:alpha-ribazole phosphatase [Methylotenera sp.]HPH06252.1 alpha-ribazole phosphatase [Methylotenera sp.]
MKLTLVRHTSLDVAPDICYGQSDVAVSANFDAEREQLQSKLAAFQFDTVYSSPLQRCHQLAQALCADSRLKLENREIQLDERLKELHFGDWEMQPWQAISREIFDRWANDYANLAPPNGETFAQLHHRSKHFVEDLASQAKDQHILVVTHGGLIRALVAEVLQMPLKRLFRMSINHASITQLEFNDDIPKLHFMNL